MLSLVSSLNPLKPIKTEQGWQFFSNGAVVPVDSHDVQVAKEQHQQAFRLQAKLSNPEGIHNQHPFNPIHRLVPQVPPVLQVEPAQHFNPEHHIGQHEEPIYRPWIPQGEDQLRSAKALFRPDFGR